MMHHADSLKIRVDYFRPKHGASSIDWRRLGFIAASRRSMHSAVLLLVAIAVVGALIG